MLPFAIQLRPGTPVHLQVAYAVRRAAVAGELSPGDPFPSVRQLSKELRINPNTAHKVVSGLVAEGLLEVVPGIGTLVAEPPAAGDDDREALLDDALERLVVEAKRLALTKAEVTSALSRHWTRLGSEDATKRELHMMNETES